MFEIYYMKRMFLNTMLILTRFLFVLLCAISGEAEVVDGRCQFIGFAH